MKLHPTDNLVRLMCDAPVGLRAKPVVDPEMNPSDPVDQPDAEDMLGNTIFGHFAVFNVWTEIHSWFEGNFLERVAPGAFAEAFQPANRGQIRLMFEHGNDPQIGNKPLGAFSVLREDKVGAYYEAELFDTDYVSQLKPALAAGQLGASFRFSVLDEEWVTPTKATAWNPGMLDERTIKRVKLYEGGPVVWGAYPDATAGLRSTTDEFVDRLARDADFVARFIERVGPKNAAHVLTNVAAPGPTTPANEAASGPEAAQRGRLVASVRTQLLALGGTR